MCCKVQHMLSYSYVCNVCNVIVRELDCLFVKISTFSHPPPSFLIMVSLLTCCQLSILLLISARCIFPDSFVYLLVVFFFNFLFRDFPRTALFIFFSEHGYLTVSEGIQLLILNFCKCLYTKCL